MSAICHHEHARDGLRGAALNTALADAEQRCATAEARMTGPRRRVLELLLEAGAPVKAYELMAAYGEDGAPAKPPTVYRALDFLSRHGFAHRIESLNAYIACREGERPHMAAFLICECCGEAREIEPFAPEHVQAAAATSGYVLSGVTVEARGLCPACAAA